ncbi:hypothetical protein ACM66B_000150 [Microbotryomycetes sp. NB124-2]
MVKALDYDFPIVHQEIPETHNNTVFSFGKHSFNVDWCVTQTDFIRASTLIQAHSLCDSLLYAKRIALVEHDTNLLLLSDGSPVCEGCSYICSVCQKTEAIVAGDEPFHTDYFRCWSCHSKS